MWQRYRPPIPAVQFTDDGYVRFMVDGFRKQARMALYHLVESGTGGSGRAGVTIRGRVFRWKDEQAALVESISNLLSVSRMAREIAIEAANRNYRKTEDYALSLLEEVTPPPYDGNVPLEEKIRRMQDGRKYWAQAKREAAASGDPNEQVPLDQRACSEGAGRPLDGLPDRDGGDPHDAAARRPLDRERPRRRAG